MKHLVRVLAVVLLGAVGSVSVVQTAQAGPLTCGTPNTTMTVDSADACQFGSGNGPNNGDDIDNLFGGTDSTWIKRGEQTSTTPNDLLTITLNSGFSWGDYPSEGSWQLANNFWSLYTGAVLKAHIGNGGGEPDWWAFLLTPGELNGTFEITNVSRTGGGGLSNFFLFGCTDSTLPNCQYDPSTPLEPVPEPGMLGLMGLGLLGLALARRKSRVQ